MAYSFHSDRDKYFTLQYNNSKNYILPFIEQYKKIEPSFNILEVGSRDGGVLAPFAEIGCYIVGVDLSAPHIEQAKNRYKELIEHGKAQFKVINVHDYALQEGAGSFDVILLKDVIEHVFGHEELLLGLKKLLKPGGVIYFGYPPWQMPFGGHQQAIKHKIVSKLPYIHLLPNFIYLNLIKMAGGDVKNTREIKKTRISIEKFYRITKNTGFKILLERHWLVSSMYMYKFGMKPRLQNKIIKSIPWVRNFFTTAVDFLVTPTR